MDHKLIDDITDYTGRVHASVSFSRRPAPGVQRQRVTLPDIHGDTVEVADALRELADRLSPRAGDEPVTPADDRKPTDEPTPADDDDAPADDGSRYTHVIIAEDHADARAYASKLSASYPVLFVTTREEAEQITDTPGVRYAVHVVWSSEPLYIAALIARVDNRFASLALPDIHAARSIAVRLRGL